MGLTTWAAFTGTDELAAVDGDFIMTAEEVQADLKALRKALGGDGWHEVKTDESTVAIDLGQVVYLNVESDEQRIGFS